MKFANLVKYDAFGLGNHDFDDGVEGLVPFIQEANFPVLASNIVRFVASVVLPVRSAISDHTLFLFNPTWPTKLIVVVQQPRSSHDVIIQSRILAKCC